MGREIRRVPANWQHPRFPEDPSVLSPVVPENRAGTYRPMFNYSYEQAVSDWRRDVDEWIDDFTCWEEGRPGRYFKVEDIEKMVYYDLYASDPPAPPNPYHFMPPDDPENGWWQLFENVSDGTPLSPPFETAGELVEWLVNNRDFWGDQWSRRSAERMVNDGYAPTLMAMNGMLFQPHQLT